MRQVSHAHGAHPQVDKALYQADWLTTYSGAERPKQLMSLPLVQYAYETIPDLPTSSAVMLVTLFRDCYDRHLASSTSAQGAVLMPALLQLVDHLDQTLALSDGEIAARSGAGANRCRGIIRAGDRVEPEYLVRRLAYEAVWGHRRIVSYVTTAYSASNSATSR